MACLNRVPVCPRGTNLAVARRAATRLEDVGRGIEPARAAPLRACKERDHDTTLLRANRRDDLEVTVSQPGAVGLAHCGAERKTVVLL